MDMDSPNRAQGSKFPATVRDVPLYTFNYDEEMQSSHNLGYTMKPLHHNMHVDELLQNVISTTENGQFVTNPSSSFPIGCLNGTSFGNKSMNEMCWEMFQGQQFKTSMENNHVHQLRLGEVDEYFAPPAAMADVQQLMPIDPNVMMPQQHEDWLTMPIQMPMQVQMPAINVHQQEELQQQFHVFENQSVFGMMYSENSMVSAMASTSSETTEGSSVIGRKRMRQDEMIENTFERKQKRMAKNRESAAKSRAKKQAYINKLEADRERLMRTNYLMYKWMEIEAETGLLSPRYQLRRTSSMPQLK